MSQVRGEPKNYHHGGLRTAAVERASAAVERDGGPTFSLRGIAAELSVAHSALYRHFADRDALLAAVAEDAFARLLASHEAALAAAGAEPIPRLRALCRNQAGFALENGAIYRLMFGPDVVPHHHPGTALHSVSQAVLDLAIATVATCQRSGELAGSDPMLGGLAFWSAMHGIACLALDDRLTPKLGGQRSLKALVNLSIDGLVAGLRQTQVWVNSEGMIER